MVDGIKFEVWAVCCIMEYTNGREWSGRGEWSLMKAIFFNYSQMVIHTHFWNFMTIQLLPLH